MFEIIWPPSLLGADGKWRTHEENEYGANDDSEALRAWISSIGKRLAPKSLESYTSSIEKLVFWAISVRLKPLSSLGKADFDAFSEFLINPPKEWVESTPFNRLASQWRPLRAPLAPSSADTVVGIASVMYTDWTRAGYIKRNPIYEFTRGNQPEILY